MTIGKKNIQCPHCGYQFEAQFYTFVRGDLDYELKEQIINGEFDLLLCPKCEKLFSFEETFIYLDPSSQILAFVLPLNEAKDEDKIKKIHSDYELIKPSLSKEKSLNFEPYYFFGVQQLTELLLNDRNIEEETEVLEVFIKESNLKQKKISPQFARKNNLPFSLPYKDEISEENILLAAKEILNKNDKLLRLKNLINIIEKKGKEDLDFILK